MAIFGLILNIVGVGLLAYAQNRLDRAVRFWLDALDFTVETILTPGPAPTIRVRGMDEQMKRAVLTNRWLSTVGWTITGIGFILQLLSFLNN